MRQFEITISVRETPDGQVQTAHEVKADHTLETDWVMQMTSMALTVETCKQEVLMQLAVLKGQNPDLSVEDAVEKLKAAVGPQLQESFNRLLVPEYLTAVATAFFEVVS